MSAALTAVLTADAPRGLVLALIGLVAAAYAVCGLLALIGRARHTPARRPETARTRIEVTS